MNNFLKKFSKTEITYILYGIIEVIAGILCNSVSVIALSIYEISIINIDKKICNKKISKLYIVVLNILTFALLSICFYKLSLIYGYHNNMVSVWIIPIMFIVICLTKAYFMLNLKDEYKNDLNNSKKYSVYDQSRLDFSIHILVSLAVFSTLFTEYYVEICVGFAICMTCFYKNIKNIKLNKKTI